MRMLSLQHGQILNQTVLGNSLGVTGPTIRHYLEILQGSFHFRILEPWLANPMKRLIKTPKVYVRDSGVFHALSGVELDLVLEHGRKRMAIETRASTVPHATSIRSATAPPLTRRPPQNPSSISQCARSASRALCAGGWRPHILWMILKRLPESSKMIAVER